MRKIKLISIITVVMALLLAGCGSNEKKITELTENAELALEHDEYDVSFDYYKQILDMDQENLKARYGIEEIFASAIYHKDYELAQTIYNYVYNLNSEDISILKFQDEIIAYDESVLNAINNGLMDAYLRSCNGREKELSRIDMELYSFIEQSGEDFKSELDYYGYTDEELSKEISRLIYFDTEGNITFDHYEIHVAISEAKYDDSGILWNVALYLADTDLKVYTGELSSSLSEFESSLPQMPESELVLLYFDNYKSDYALTSKGYAYDINGDYYILLNSCIPIPEQLWGAVLYNQTDDEYYAVVQTDSSGSTYPVGAIQVSKSEAEMLVELSKNSETSESWGYSTVLDYFGYGDKYWLLDVSDERGERWTFFENGEAIEAVIKDNIIYSTDGDIIGEVQGDDFVLY